MKVFVFVIHLLHCSTHYLKKILKFETIILKLLVKSMFPTFVFVFRVSVIRAYMFTTVTHSLTRIFIKCPSISPV